MGKILLGFDEEHGCEYNAPDSDDQVSERIDQKKEAEKKRVDTRNRHIYLSEKRTAEIMSGMKVVVVQEFGDDYHLTEEERQASNAYYSVFKALRDNGKHTYHKLDKYVDAVRRTLECLDAVAADNGVYDPDKFKLLWLKGKISITGLTMPIYRGRDRKDVSWEYVVDFVLSKKDPHEILVDVDNVEEDPLITSDDMDNAKDSLFAPGELEGIIEEIKNDEEIPDRAFDEEDIECGMPIAIQCSDKESRRMIKESEGLRHTLQEIRRKDRKSRNLEMYAWDVRESDLEAIERNNREYRYVSSSEVPEFHGDITNSNDYHKYMYELKEYEDTQIEENYGGVLKSNSQIREIELKQLLESNGWNIRNMYDNRKKEKEFKRMEKETKRKQRKLKSKLLALEQRAKRRDMELRKMKDTKKGKKSNKKMNKGRKMAKKITKERKQDVDDFMLDYMESDAFSLKEAGEDILDFRMGNK